MIKEISITVLPKDEKSPKIIKSLLKKELNKLGIKDDFESLFIKKSIDARHGQVKLHLRYRVFIGESPADYKSFVPSWKNANGNKSVIIVGSGPAGLFGALKLLEKGIKPIIIERGQETSLRKKEIALISTKNVVNPNSNYCFGEGGAGTFSDGKLYTRSNKRGNIDKILNIFVEFGADKKILTDAHPHIGTNKLPTVINNMRYKICELGGEFHFNSQVVDFIVQDGFAKGVVVQNTVTNQKENLLADSILLATGHSANDIYTLIADKSPSSLQAKTFAVGVRVEHPRALIDSIQFHGKMDENLGAAEYRLTTQVNERGVYSFCMCPGGFVVPSSSSPDEIVVNGMSSAERNSKWSNAAIVVEIRPEDIPNEFVNQAEKNNHKELAGLYYRTYLEKLAKQNGQNQAAPCQKLCDFLNGKLSDELPSTSYTVGVVSSRLDEWIPEHISSRLKQGFINFDKNMKGFISEDALLIAMETRTSTPVRILRDKETFECEGIKNLYPAGEGSGYSGGIVSSAMDGENACEKIIERLL